MRINGVRAAPWTPVYVQIDLKDAVITFSDGTGTPNTLAIKIGEGNLTYSESRNMQYTLNRGLLDEVREGDEVPVDVSLDILWDFLTRAVVSGGTPSPEDFLKKRGNAAAYISTDSDLCRPYAIDIIIVYTPSCAAESAETITLSDYRWEGISHDLRAGTLATTGKCNITEATSARS